MRYSGTGQLDTQVEAHRLVHTMPAKIIRVPFDIDHRP